MLNKNTYREGWNNIGFKYIVDVTPSYKTNKDE